MPRPPSPPPSPRTPSSLLTLLRTFASLPIWYSLWVHCWLERLIDSHQFRLMASRGRYSCWRRAAEHASRRPPPCLPIVSGVAAPSTCCRRFSGARCGTRELAVYASSSSGRRWGRSQIRSKASVLHLLSKVGIVSRAA